MLKSNKNYSNNGLWYSFCWEFYSLENDIIICYFSLQKIRIKSIKKHMLS